MFKTKRCFRTHAQRKRIFSRGGARGEGVGDGGGGVRIDRIYLPQYWLPILLLSIKYFLSPCCVWIWNTQMNNGGICLASTPVLFLIPVDIRREERKCAFIFAVCDYLLTSLRFDTYRNVVLFFLFTLWSDGCIKMNRIWKIVDALKNGCVASGVRTVLGFVHVTWMTLFTERTTVGFDAWQLVQAEMFSMMDETSFEVLTWNSYLWFLTAESKLLLWLPRL